MPPRTSSSRNVRARSSGAAVGRRGTRRPRDPTPTPSSSSASEAERQSPPPAPIVQDWMPQYTYLSQHPEEIRPMVYDRTHPTKGLMIEKRVDRHAFQGFRVVETFEDYGWGGALDFDSRGIHVDLVREWMRTLRRERRQGRDTVALIGTVQGLDVTMTAPRIRELFAVDTGIRANRERGEATHYECIDTRSNFATFGLDAVTVADAIFTEAGPNLRKNLVPLAKALIKIIDANVNPRDSDARKVRDQDQIVLYALMTGQRAISYAYNAMCNIWWYYDQRYRTSTPHVCLISAFIARVLGERVRNAAPLEFHDRTIQPVLSHYKTIAFEVRNGRHIIRDLDHHTEFICSGAPDHQEEAIPPYQPQFGGVRYEAGPSGASSGVHASESDFAAFGRRYDADMAALTAQLERQSLAIEEVRAISAAHFYTDEYYAHAAHRGGRSTLDPMDIDGLQTPYHPAPIYWRTGDAQEYPPHVHYTDYVPPGEGQYQHQFDQSVADSIFGYPPPYPRYPPPQ